MFGSESHIPAGVSCEECPGAWDAWIIKRTWGEVAAQAHSAYGVGTVWFCMVLEDYVGLQRETIDPIHEKHLLKELSRTNRLIYEIYKHLVTENT